MVELFQQHQERSKAMLMDIKMAVMNGLEATKIIRESNKLTEANKNRPTVRFAYFILSNFIR